MGRATGKIVYRDHWQDHLVEIIDKGDNRSLYFSGDVLQSTMSISAPHRLVLSYTRFMMATLLFNNPPCRVLMVGVGAGSLIRFLHHHFPECSIDGVDYSAGILKLAKGYFNLPDSRKIALHDGDGQEVLADLTGRSYDLILIDAFDQDGMAPSIYCDGFFKQCLHHLDQDGLVSLNLWSGDGRKMDRVQTDLERNFSSRLLLQVPERGNVVCIAGRNPKLSIIMERDYTELSRMSAEFNINFQEIVRVVIKQNLGFRQRIARFFS